MGALTLLRLGFFALTQGVPTADEAAHYSYVQSLWQLEGIPVTGEDLVSEDAIALFKGSLSGGGRNSPQQATSDDPGWGLAREQYQGFQGPVYHILLLPIYAVGLPLSNEHTLLLMRLASIIMALAALPVAYLLARELFPRLGIIWLLAPALLLAMNSFATQPGVVSNDAVMPLLGGVTLLAFARCWRGLSAGNALVLGLVLAASVIAKSTAIVLVPALGVGVVALLHRNRSDLASVRRWLVYLVAGAGVLLVPWLVWNLHAYGSMSGRVKANGILAEPLIGRRTRSWEDARQLASSSFDQMWRWEGLSQGPAIRLHIRLWQLMLLAASVLGPLAALARGWKREAAVLTWLATLVPVGLLVLIGACMFPSDGYGAVVGRHLLVLLPAVACLMTGALAVSVRRWAQPLVALVVLAAIAWEGPAVASLATSNYSRFAIEGSAPAAGATYNGGWKSGGPVVVEPPCAATHLALPLDQAAQSGPSQAGMPLERVGVVSSMSLWRLASPSANSIRLDVPATHRLAAPSPGEEVVAWTGGGAMAQPVAAVVLCRSADAEATAFRWLHGQEHVIPLPLRLVRAWPWIVVLATVAALVMCALVVVHGTGRPRSRAV